MKSNDGFVETYALSDDTKVRKNGDKQRSLTSTRRTGSWSSPRRMTRLSMLAG